MVIANHQLAAAFSSALQVCLELTEVITQIAHIIVTSRTTGINITIDLSTFNHFLRLICQMCSETALNLISQLRTQLNVERGWLYIRVSGSLARNQAYALHLTVDVRSRLRYSGTWIPVDQFSVPGD